MSSDIKDLIEQIESGNDLTTIQLDRFADDLLHEQSSNNACRIFLALLNAQKSVSDENYERVCKIIINNHDRSARENAIRIIDLLIASQRNDSEPCLQAVGVALEDQQSNILRRYASKILLTIIRNQKEIRLSSFLQTAMSRALLDTDVNVQKHTLESLKELVQNDASSLSEENVAGLTTYLSNIYLNVAQYYNPCVFVTSFFLDFLHRQHQLPLNLLEIFSKFLIVDVSGKNDRLLNCQAAKLLRLAIRKQLLREVSTQEVFVNLSKCFNSKFYENEELCECCLQILCTLDEHQLKMTQIDGSLFKVYLIEGNFDDNLRANLRILFGRLYRMSYAYSDEESSTSIVDETIDMLIAGLDQDQFLSSSVDALTNIALTDDRYLSIYPLRIFVLLLNRNDIDRDLRQNAGVILHLAIRKQLPVTHSELQALENALHDSNSTLSLTALQAFANLFENDPQNTDLIKPYANTISTFATELISNSSDVVLTANASKLLEVVLRDGLRVDWTHDEMANLCTGLQRHTDSTIRRSIVNLLEQIISKRSDTPSYICTLLKLEKLSEDFLERNNIHQLDCQRFETNLTEYSHQSIFEKRTIPVNLLDAIHRLLKTDRSSDHLVPISILHQCAENNLTFPTDLLDTLFERFQKHPSEMCIRTLHLLVVQNGQSLSSKSLQQLESYLLTDRTLSKDPFEIMKLLIMRNQMEINRTLVDRLIQLIQHPIENEIRRILIETFAYACENLPYSIQVPIETILPLLEENLRSESSTEAMKYSCCLALNALPTHQVKFSPSTITLLRSYAQNDHLTSTIDLREISLTLLKKSLPKGEIDDLIKHARIEEDMSDFPNLSKRLQATQDLISMVEQGKVSVSASQMNILEHTLMLSNSSTEYRRIVLQIFLQLSSKLTSSQMKMVFYFLKDTQCNTVVVEICKALVDLQRTFSMDILKELLDFVVHDVHQSLRDSVLDCLTGIIDYHQDIPAALLKNIKLEIGVRDLRNSKKDVSEKILAWNRCQQSICDQPRLSLNTIESLEYLLQTPATLRDIEEEVLSTIELAIKNGETFPSSFLDDFNRLTQVDRRRIIRMIDHLSINPAQQITLEIFDGCQEHVDESIYILLKGTQNGWRLSPKMSEQLKTILNNPEKHEHHYRVLKILQNQAKTHRMLDDNLLECLEDHFRIQTQPIVSGILKYLPTYRPSDSINATVRKHFEDHPYNHQIRNLLDGICEAPNHVKWHFIQILSLIESIPFDIEENPLLLLARQLLCHDLLVHIAQKHPFEELDQFEFYTHLNALEEWFTFPFYSIERDEILMFLIENSSKWTLKDMNNIFLLLKTDPRALNILFQSASNNCIPNLQTHWLHSMVKRFVYIRSDETVQLNEDQARKILDLLLNKLRWSIPLSECFLQRIHHVEDFNQLIDFLRYLNERNRSHLMDFSHYFVRRESETMIAKDLYSWLLDIQADIIKRKLLDLCQEPKSLANLEAIILSIRLNHWSFDIFERLIEILKTKTDRSLELRIEDLTSSLLIIHQFGISNEHEGAVESIFKSNQSQVWVKEIHRFVVSVSFDRHEYEKSLKDLIKEIDKLNDSKQTVSVENLESSYRQVITAYTADSNFHAMGKPICHWNENNVREWSSHYKSEQKGISEKWTFEVISVVQQAVFLHNPKQKFKPRTIQILALLLLLDASNRNLPRLAQIQTGEGKSVIIAMFAAIKALHGQQIDIVTTSPLLAKRDAGNKQSFYRMLSLTVGQNGGTSAVKTCYKNDVVYGSVNEFQFDVLKDQYSLLGTRCGRRFDLAIVDEVDSMLIDENSKICRLSSRIPAIDELKVILTLIWQELNRIYQRIVQIENKLYCILVPFRIDKDGQIVVMQTAEADDEGNILQNPADDQENFLEIENPYSFIESHIENYIINKLLKPNEKNECLITLPKHLNSFVQQQLSKWIYNAWQAKFAYQENVDYLISDESHGRRAIVPVDYRNTGIVQTNTSWPDGLHQFLQIKHQLRISPENLTTNFLSNVAFFRLYRKNLFGLTGTLGTQEAKDLIHHIYDVDFVLVPPYKYTQFVPFPDRLCLSEDEWNWECVESIFTAAKIHQRAVLVICETKFNATKIYEKLIEKDPPMKRMIKLYTRSDNEEQNAIDKEFDCGEIIIATNLAGRGTDVGTTAKVEENGGLHVLVTFLPMNVRVEHQAFGRTSRQGKRGTAQLLVLSSMDGGKTYATMEELKEERDRTEKCLIDRAKTIDLKNIERRDRLFLKFCNLRNELRERENDSYKLDSVEERWGLWLKVTFAKEDSMTGTVINDLTDQSVDQKFDEFRAKISHDYSSNEIFENPFYLVLKANEYIFNMKRYDVAIPLLEHAIQSDPIFSVSARYNLAYALIRQSTDNKVKAKSELENALETIENIFISQQQAMLISFGIDHNESNANDEAKMKSDAEEQMFNRVNLLYLCKSQIEQGLAIIEEAMTKEHGIKLEYKALDEFFSDIDKPTLDITEFKESGFVGFFQLTVKEPTPWLSIIAVGIIGLAQAAAGAAIIIFSGGAAASIGGMLLSEGVNDMIFAIKCAVTGEFSWKEYGIQKAISLTITIATCGFGALKEVGQLVRSGFKGCAAMVKTATIGGTQLMGQFTKESWKLVGKQIVNAFAKQGAKEILTTVLDKTILAELSERMNREISDNIEGKVNGEVISNETIHQCLGVDAALNRPNAHGQEIERITHRILHPQSNRFTQAAIIIAKGILNRLTDGKSGRLFQIITAGKCLTELQTFLEDFLVEFKKELEKLREQVKIDHLLHSNRSNDVDKRTAKEITESLHKDHYIDKDNVKVLKPLECPTFKLRQHQHHQTYVMTICNNIYVQTESRKRSEYDFQKNLITKALTTKLASYMTNRLNAELINPVVHAGVDVTVNDLSNRIERACADSRGTLEEQIQQRRAQNDIIRKGRLLGKSVDKQQTNDAIVHAEIESLARSVETDAPGDLKDIIALSAKLGCPIQIYRNGKYDLTIGDAHSGKALTVNFGAGQRGDIGHYSSSENAPMTGANDCLFDTLSAQTGKSTTELRGLAAAGIRENSSLFLKMMPSLHFLGGNPDRSLLYIGGKNVRNHSPDDILDDRYLPSREKLLGDLEKLLEETKKAQSKSDRNPSESSGELVLETLIHDIKDQKINKVIAQDKAMRHIFYESINRRLAYYRKENGEFLKQSDELKSRFDNAASYWRGATRPQGVWQLFYSQANVNANFSTCGSAEAIDFLPQPVREKIANQRVDTAGKKTIEKFGPAVCPVQFCRYDNKMVVIDNRMTLAHSLAKVEPLRLIPIKPSETESGRMKKPGMPSQERPKYDKNN